MKKISALEPILVEKINENYLSETLNEKAITYLNVNNLCAGKYQPRTHFDESSLIELANSIKENNIIQPIVVRQISNGFEIVAGERRWRAARLAGLTVVPAIITDISDEKALLLGLIENLQRKDLNPIEEATGIQRLIDEFTLTHQQVADKLGGRSRASISNMLRLLKLDTSVQQLLIEHKIEMGHARALLPLPNSQQFEIAQLIISKNLTVRQTEKLVKKYLHSEEKVFAGASISFTNLPDRIHFLQQQLLAQSNVQMEYIYDKKGKGKIYFQFNNLPEFEHLCYLLDKLL